MKLKKADLTRRASAMSNRGAHLFKAGLLDKAETCFKTAIALGPELHEPWQNLGATYVEMGRHEDAIPCLEKSIELSGGNATTFASMAVSLRMRNRLDEAMAFCSKSITLDPDLDQSRLMLAHLHLLNGNMEEGWEIHEWAREFEYNRDYMHCLWRGENPRGQTVLILGEQGFGDDLHFIRYAKLVKNLGAKVVFGCKPPLARLMKTVPGIDVVHPFNQPPPQFHWFAPVMRLPAIFGTTLDSIPSDVPYLSADPDDVQIWAERLSDDHNMRVGLCWAGSARKHDPRVNRVDRRRSMRLADFAPLASVPAVTYYSLQLGDGAGQKPPSGMHLVDMTEHIRDFADTAALIENLDLVIAVDTSVCHLAGGLGKPVWMLSRFDCCWRWLMDRDDTPWYPTMRIYRQKHIGEWMPVVEQITSDLHDLSRTHQRGAIQC